MYVPMHALVALVLLAAMPVALLLAALDHEMRRHGLRLLGRQDLYLDDHVLEERWCVLYVPVRKRVGCHSLASL